jgi:glucose dehydrogenase
VSGGNFLGRLVYADVPVPSIHPQRSLYGTATTSLACAQWEERMNRCTTTMLAGGMIAVSPALAADVTPERLINAVREPQNWLMNHRTYDGQRFSPLSRINRDNVKNLKLAFAVPLGGQVGNGAIEATPLAENGFLYITDSSGVLYKIDATSGSAGRIVWAMDPKQDRPLVNRGAAFRLSALAPSARSSAAATRCHSLQLHRIAYDLNERPWL